MVSIIRASSGEAGIPEGFPILLDTDMAIIEPAFAWLLEYTVFGGRSRAGDTVRTYGEHLYDWFDSLEQSGLDWRNVDEGVIAAYRNRMLGAPSPHTGRPYARSTINGRISTVCRFYDWADARGFIAASPVRRVERVTLGIGEGQAGLRRSLFNQLSVRTSERLPRPLRPDELARLFEKLDPTARLAAEWALTAGLRRKELCGLSVDLIPDSFALDPEAQPLVGVPLAITKGGKPRTVYPPLRLIDRTNWYVGEVRGAIVRHARGRRQDYRAPDNLLLNTRGDSLSRARLTAKLATAFAATGIDGTLHWLRHTFAMAMLVRLQIQARSNPDLNPLKVLQVLMGHTSITTTAIYLRCVELHERDLAESLSFLYGEMILDEV
ncbi:MAG: tyrosine-type recombinase/integrase [Acidimicrobiaceae bacterium]|nr:tyrosine-type recombinase/integrase [Acidimicrobiaceae bacterium]